MKIRLIFSLCCVLFSINQVLAEADNETKKGLYPFMAFLYYSDESVIESTDTRFLRGAVLVKPDWLITSSVGPAMINDLPHGFPRKTLLARLGAVSIDFKFTLNEDEDEQEREVIQSVRPHNQSKTQWWRTDITLLKTLTPFNLTSVVSLATLNIKNDYNYTSCFILVFSRRSSNWTEERTLMQLFVNVLPPSSKCGNYYSEETMICANDDDGNKNYDPEFCFGNSGGPLVCENEVIGIQTYIENNCRQPHLYQRLSAWDNFITCGIEDKCNEKHCAKLCLVTNKDSFVTNEITTEELKAHILDNNLKLTEEITMPSSTVERLRYQEVLFSSTTLTPTTQIVTEEVTTSTQTSSTETKTTEIVNETSWPKEKLPQRENVVEKEDLKIERKTNVEAQRHDVKKARGAANRNMYFFQSLFSISILTCLI